MRNIIFIAPPAAGKGTQSAILEKKYKLPHISTGDILREESKKDSELGRYISEVLSSGSLVKDKVTYELLKKRLSQADCKNGYVLDGFPRNIEQAYKYDEILSSLNQELGYVIQLDIDEETLEKRITGRRICENLKCFGVEIDEAKNHEFRDEGRISSPNSKVEVWVVPTNEELMIARDTKDLITK